MPASARAGVTLASVGDDSADDPSKIDREAILSRRHLLIALATSGLTAPGLRAAAQGPSVCLSPPRPPPEFEALYTLEVARDALSPEQRDRIAAIAGRWTDQRIRTTVWVQGHLRDRASDAARAAALRRAELVAAELHGHGVLERYVVMGAAPPPHTLRGAPIRITPRSVTLWVQVL